MTKKIMPVPTLLYTRIYARNLLSKFWYNWVSLRRGIEIVPLDSLKITDTAMAPWKFLQLKWHRSPVAGSTVPPSAGLLTLLQSANPTLFPSARLILSPQAVPDIHISRRCPTLSPSARPVAFQSARPLLSSSAALIGYH
jgi:hypothetical protein